MRRRLIRRRLHFVLAGFFLLLSLTLASAWAWSYWHAIRVWRDGKGTGCGVQVDWGRLEVWWAVWGGYPRTATTYDFSLIWPASPPSPPDPYWNNGPENHWAWGGFEVGYGATLTSPNAVGLTLPLWFVLPWCLFVSWFFWWRGRKAGIVSGFCRKCGYDLRASKGTCPECGTPIPAGLVREPL